METGGKVLASGGYGCVFSPALKCEGSNHTISSSKNSISKLMINRHATEEYEEIMNIKKKLDSIKQYDQYFLLDDITICKPAKLSRADLNNFSKKCTALPKRNITKSNINSKLDEIMSLNIPNGGIPVDDYIYEDGSFVKLYHLHCSMIKLLKHGILPMNKKNVYHSDVKDSNILVDDTPSNENKINIKTRLIDWGLTAEYIPFENNPFPKSWRNRPFQFNVPFSVIIFSDDFVERYTKYINKGGKYKTIEEVKPFVIDYITFWNKKRGPGHYKFINEIFYLLYSNDLTTISTRDKPKIIETEFVMPTIIQYISAILVQYTAFRKDGTLNLREYLDNVFIKNIDIWGFINSYYAFIELLSNNFTLLNEKQKELLNHIKHIYISYLYQLPTDAISIENLEEDLNIMKSMLFALSDNPKAMGMRSKKHNKTLSKRSRRSVTNSMQRLASGKKTRKNINKIFKRKQMQKRFKHPVFLSSTFRKK